MQRLLLLAAIWLAAAGHMATAYAAELHGHRGARGLLPENTLPAFKKALQLGVDCLELDVGLTRDRQLVIAHDRSTNPAIARKGKTWITAPTPLMNLSASDIAIFDVGRINPDARYAKRFPEQRGLDDVRMPLLRDLLALDELHRAANVCLNIEIKTSPDAPHETFAPAEIATALIRLMDATGYRRRLRVQSFHWHSLVHIKRMAPDIPLIFLTAERSWLDNVKRGLPGKSNWLAGLDIDDFKGSVPAAIKHLGGSVWSPYHRDLKPVQLALAHKHGLKVVVWTVNKPADMKRYIEMGVDGIITDYPDRAVAIMRRP